jgi:hypothetical protein
MSSRDFARGSVHQMSAEITRTLHALSSAHPHVLPGPSGGARICIDLNQPNAHKFVLDHIVLPHCISELPNSDPEIRSIKIYKSRLVEEVILIRIVKT